ncbi:MAG: ATP-binding protein [Pseudomonadota bacterium]|nr:ATP-binding protein [Pseudomonadota bacterium]
MTLDPARAPRMPLPAWCAAIPIAVSLLVLLGWAADVETLKRISPGLVAMNPMTAVAFVLAGVSLWLQRPGAANASPSPGSTRTARLAAAAVIAIGMFKLGEVAFGWAVGVDQWLFANRLGSAGTALPNRMAPNTAMNFVLLGLALLALDVTTRRGRRPSELLASGVFLVAMLALMGYVYQVREFAGLANVIPMALPTALSFVVLALGVLMARPNAGAMAVVASPGSGGMAARRLFPGMVLAMLVLGWLRLEGQRRGLFGLELGVTLYTIANITIVGALVWWSARSLQHLEAERERVAAVRDQALALNRLIMDHSLDVICAVDGEGRFVEVSAAALSLWGYAPSELVGRAYADLVHPDDVASTAKAAGEVMAGQPTGDFSNRYLRKDGSPVDIDWSAIWSEADGMMFCVARDATRRKQAEQAVLALNAELQANGEQLQQSNRELEAFSYSVSHDLRAPLRHIDGYARILQEDAGDQLDAEMRRYLDAVGDSARQMGALIDDLLAFSRLGRKPVQRVDVDMGALVQRVAAELRVDGDPRVSIGPLPAAHADPVLFKQVWLNLLSNAIKYSAPRGDEARVEVSGERSGDRVQYRIRDNGVGFDMRYADKLFGVFQRLHSQDEFQGTGVGLAIVQRIVARHGGSIAADSQPGLGATFTFELPLGADTTAMDASK